MTKGPTKSSDRRTQKTPKNGNVSSPADVEQREQRKAFVDAYTQAVSQLAVVDYVFFCETPAELDVFTVFRGDRRALRPVLYQVEAEMLGRFPRAEPDVRLLPLEYADVESLRMTTHEAFARS